MARKRGRTRSRGAKDGSTTVPTISPDQGAISPDQGVNRVEARRRVLGNEVCCALCEREVDRSTVHHLVPRARGGNHGPTARLCPTCHRQVHAMFSETTLADELYSVELLRANPRVASFLRWMRKQRGAAFRVRRAKDRA